MFALNFAPRLCTHTQAAQAKGRERARAGDDLIAKPAPQLKSTEEAKRKNNLDRRPILHALLVVDHALPFSLVRPFEIYFGKPHNKSSSLNAMIRNGLLVVICPVSLFPSHQKIVLICSRVLIVIFYLI